MARYVDLNNNKIINVGRDRFGNSLYAIPPDLPTENVRENIQAYWIPVDELGDAFDCSNCPAMVQKKTNFCPRCGAEMQGE